MSDQQPEDTQLTHVEHDKLNIFLLTCRNKGLEYTAGRYELHFLQHVQQACEKIGTAVKKETDRRLEPR